MPLRSCRTSPSITIKEPSCRPLPWRSHRAIHRRRPQSRQDFQCCCLHDDHCHPNIHCCRRRIDVVLSIANAVTPTIAAVAVAVTRTFHCCHRRRCCIAVAHSIAVTITLTNADIAFAVAVAPSIAIATVTVALPSRRPSPSLSRCHRAFHRHCRFRHHHWLSLPPICATPPLPSIAASSHY